MDDSQTVYRIAKWAETFERAESRKLKQLTWIAMPVGFNSTGYQAMLEEFEDRAPAVYGAWCALCAYAATCHVRGTLGNSRGIPLKISHVARITGFPESVFRELFAWASRSDIGWLEAVPAGEVAEGIAENHAKHSESIASGESPDDLPPPRGNPPSTRPDRTEPNLTVPDITRRSTEWAAASFAFRESVRELASELQDLSLRKILRGVDQDLIWRMCWVAVDFDKPGFLYAISKIKDGDIDKHRNYLGRVMVRMCEAKSESWDQLKQLVPPFVKQQQPAEVA